MLIKNIHGERILDLKHRLVTPLTLARSGREQEAIYKMAGRQHRRSFERVAEQSERLEIIFWEKIHHILSGKGSHRKFKLYGERSQNMEKPWGFHYIIELPQIVLLLLQLGHTLRVSQPCDL